METWPFRNIVFAVAALFAVYFPIAFALQASYVPENPPQFQKRIGHSYRMTSPDLDATADSEDEPTRSRLQLYEDDKSLGPAHSTHRDISELGHGRFSHWQGLGIIFSASDNSDPNTNGRRYSIRNMEGGR